MKDKTMLLNFDSGLGDVLMITPQLKYYYDKGYLATLLCREAVAKSHLLDNCPYVKDLCIIPNPWDGWEDGEYNNIIEENKKVFNGMKDLFDVAFYRRHQKINVHNMTVNNRIMGIHKLENYTPKVFISDEADEWAKEYVKQFSDGYIFVHTKIENHPGHDWDASEWIEQNLDDLPIVDTGKDMLHYMLNEDINCSFALAKYAKHRVLSSSVMVHACDAMGLYIDVINYGKPDRKVWPVNIDNVLRIRELGQWLEDFKEKHLLYNGIFE